jgi:Glycosyl hydrolases family 2, sugar binding domain/Glycosyl hydrolases family 2
MRKILLLGFLLILSPTVLAQSQSLDGVWQFAPDRDGKITIAELGSLTGWRDARVPASWNEQFADLRDYRGVAWYRKRITLNPITPTETVTLRFGAVDYFAEVFVNGQKAGEHEGGFLPFALDAGKLLKAGENEIAVRVIDPDSDKARWGDRNFDEIPHGKQSWYVHTGGLWQSASLQVRPATYIDRVYVTSKINGEVNVDVHLAGSFAKDPGGLRAVVKNDQGTIEFNTPGNVVLAEKRAQLRGRIKAPRLWHPNTPVLYFIEVSLTGNSDVWTGRFGLRAFEARDGHLFLNNEPIYIVSALDQDFYPEGIYRPPSYEFLVKQMRRAKELGLNMLRTHIKVPVPDYLRAADEAGILIWYEVPSWSDNTWSPEAARRGEETFLGMLDRDWNHPSVVIMSVINEAWGVKGLRDARERDWLKQAYDRLKPKAAAAGRLVVDNSPCCENFHLKSDIADFHQYYSIPDRAREWDKWVADLASRPAWLWSKHGDAAPTGKEPIVLSEFGNWGLPALPKELPWWFERDFGGREITRPAGVFDRFHGFKFDRLFSGFNDLALATQRHQWISLKYEIEAIRTHASIQGYTITEFTDLNWECNGILDMYRNNKVYASDLARIQQQDVIFTRLTEFNFAGGTNIELPLYVSRFSKSAEEKLTASVSLEGKTLGQTEVPAGTRGETKITSPLKFSLPETTEPRVVKLRLELKSGDGRMIADNHADLFVYPRNRPAASVIHLGGGLSRLEQPLRSSGYTIIPTLTTSAVTITDRIDAQAVSLLEAGARIVVLADSADALPAQSSIKITKRSGELSGNWVTNFNWINVNSAPFKAVAFDKLLGLESLSVIPEYVIQGVPGSDYEDVYAGIFYGWINQNAALALGAQSGRGRLFLTTLRLADGYGKDEYATHLLDEIMRFVRSDSFSPRIQLK